MVERTNDPERRTEDLLATLEKEVDDREQCTWFSDKASRAVVLGEFVKLYFGRKDEETWPLRLTLQCEADKATSIGALAFHADGVAYPIAIQPRCWSQDEGSGRRWLILDMPIPDDLAGLAQALSGALAVVVSFQGDDRSWDWQVPRPQLDSLRRVHTVWSALRAIETGR